MLLQDILVGLVSTDSVLGTGEVGRLRAYAGNTTNCAMSLDVEVVLSRLEEGWHLEIRPTYDELDLVKRLLGSLGHLLKNLDLAVGETNSRVRILQLCLDLLLVVGQLSIVSDLFAKRPRREIAHGRQIAALGKAGADRIDKSSVPTGALVDGDGGLEDRADTSECLPGLTRRLFGSQQTPKGTH